MSPSGEEHNFSCEVLNERNKKEDPILNMTPKQVTRVLIAQQPQTTSIHRGAACS